jgi:GTP-binding protein
MFANNWAEMPQYFVTSATESVERRICKLSYVDELARKFRNVVNFLEFVG